MTHQQLRASMTTRELVEWQLLEHIDPWGELREDWRAALIASVIYNVAAQKEKQLKVSDFLLRFNGEEAPKQLTADESIAAIAEINRALGGLDLRKEAAE